MSANALLFWMSARRQGSWQQFRAAVEELHIDEDDVMDAEDEDAPDQLAPSVYQTLRLNLQRMGHAEFFSGVDGADWQVSPPSLAVTQTEHGWFGVLAGARTLKLLQRVEAAGTSEKLQTISFPAYPDQILVFADSQEALATVAERVGLFLQRDAPAAILACLPPIDDPSVYNPFPLPLGREWRIDRFSAEDLRWRPATRNDAESASSDLFRFSLRHQRYLMFCSKGASFRVSGQVGKFLVLRRRRRRRVLLYDALKGSLSVPTSCRPPFLIERALILCSGSPPSYEGSARAGILHYVEIPERIAALAAALLRQEFR